MGGEEEPVTGGRGRARDDRVESWRAAAVAGA